MHEIAANVIPIAAVVLAAVAFWWLELRGEPTAPAPEPDPSRCLTGDDVADIERQLGLSLPTSYKQYLQNRRSDGVDSQSVCDDHEVVVEATLAYRSGFVETLPPWPHTYVYVGAEADACPYVLDVSTEEVLQLHKGNIESKPLQHYANFLAFVAALSSAS